MDLPTPQLPNPNAKRRYNPGSDEPILIGGGNTNRRRQRGRDKNLERMPRIIDDKNLVTQPGFPSPAPYTPIKQTRAVNKVYNTY